MGTRSGRSDLSGRRWRRWMVAIRVPPRRPPRPDRSRRPARGRWPRAWRHSVRRLCAARLDRACDAVRHATAPAATGRRAMIGLRARHTTELLPVEAVKEAALVLRGGSVRAVLECQTLAFGIKGEPEQRAVVAGWSSLLNSLTHPLQVVIRTRRLETSALPPPADHNQALRNSYRELVETLTEERRVLDRRFFVVVPWDAPKSHQPGDARQFLDQRVAWVTECLRRLDLEPRRLSDHSLADLMRRPMDPATSVQPTAVDDELADVSSLIAPAALTECADRVPLSGRHPRVIA